MHALAALLLALVTGLAPVADEVADQLKELKAAYKAKASADAVQLFDRLVQSFPTLEPKRQEEVVKVVEAAFPSRRDEGDDVEKLFIGAAAALANMGAPGEKAMARSLALKHVTAKPAVLATLVEGLGLQANPAQVDALVGWLAPDKPLGIHAPVVAAAARALARYRAAEPALRKKIVGALVQRYGALQKVVDAERAKAEPSAEIETAFQQIEVPVLEALRALAGERFENAADWAAWWAKAKDEEWKVAADPDPGRPSRIPLDPSDPKKKDGGPAPFRRP